MEDLQRGVEAGEKVHVWLMNFEDPAQHPSMHFILVDTAAVIGELRDEGRRILVHCVAAEQCAPTVAVAYVVHRGQEAAEAGAAVSRALPGLRVCGLLSATVTGRSWESPPVIHTASHMDGPRDWHYTFQRLYDQALLIMAYERSNAPYR